MPRGESIVAGLSAVGIWEPCGSPRNDIEKNHTELVDSTVHDTRAENATAADGPAGDRYLTMPTTKGFISATVFIVSVVLLAAGWTVKGDIEEAVRPDSDDFVRAGEAMIYWIVTGGSNYEAMQSHPVFPHYFVSSVAIAAVHMYFSDPVLTVVALNAVLFSLLVVLLYQLWITVHGTWTHWGGKRGFVVGGIGGFYIVFGLPDAFLLSYTVLTDIIFLFWVTVFVVAASRGILDGSWKAWLIALVVAAAAPYVRPTGVLLPVLFVYALLVAMLMQRGTKGSVIAAVSIGAPVAVTLLVVPWIVSAKINGAVWVNTVVPDLFQREFNQAVYFFETGMVVSNRPETYIQSPSSFLDVLKIIVYRIIYYWVPLRLGEAPYSVVHNIVNLAYMVVTWPLMIVGIWRLAGIGRSYRALVLLLVMVGLAYALLHSITLLSFGWRYQLPAMVPLWILAGVGLFVVLGYPVRVGTEVVQVGRGPGTSCSGSGQ